MMNSEKGRVKGILNFEKYITLINKVPLRITILQIMQ